MKKAIQKDRVKLSSLDILQVLNNLGVRVANARKGQWIEAFCCFHNDGEHPNLQIKRNGGIFKCFSCGAKGNILHIVQQMLGTDREGAWNYLRTTPLMPITVEHLRYQLQERQRVEVNKMAEQIDIALIALYDMIRPSQSHIALMSALEVTDHLGFLHRLEPDRLFCEQLVDNLADFSYEVKTALKQGDVDKYLEFKMSADRLFKRVKQYPFMKNTKRRVVGRFGVYHTTDLIRGLF